MLDLGPFINNFTKSVGGSPATRAFFTNPITTTVLMVLATLLIYVGIMGYTTTASVVRAAIVTMLMLGTINTLQYYSVFYEASQTHEEALLQNTISGVYNPVG